MSKLTIWHLKLRHLSFSKDRRDAFFVHVAHESMNEFEVVKWAKTAIHSPAWWEGYIITEVTEGGKLWAAHGVQLLQEED